MQFPATAFMQNLIELGYGYDDPTGKTFTEALSKTINMGVFRDHRHVRCNIHDAANYGKYRTEMGD